MCSAHGRKHDRVSYVRNLPAYIQQLQVQQAAMTYYVVLHLCVAHGSCWCPFARFRRRRVPPLFAVAGAGIGGLYILLDAASISLALWAWAYIACPRQLDPALL